MEIVVEGKDKVTAEGESGVVEQGVRLGCCRTYLTG